MPFNAATAYDNNTVYMVTGDEGTDSFMTSMPIVLQSDLTTINGTLGHQYKIPGSLSCSGFASMIAAKNRYVHLICKGLNLDPGSRFSWDITTNPEPIVTPLQLAKNESGSVYLQGWYSNKTMNMAPLYTNDTGYAESFVFSDGEYSYSINSAGDVAAYTITNFGGNFTSINPNYEAPPNLSVSSIILIVIGAIAVALGLFFARRWFVTWRDRKRLHMDECLEEHPAGIALESLQESHSDITLIIPNTGEVNNGRATEQQLQHDLSSASMVSSHGRGDGLELLAFSTHPSPTIVTTNIDSS
ncbi:hypothetical protein EDD21DRAFT_106397 [Dissophora ornata]|nr:hypothetical protein EDD21DRAFT_106397 [Dissophora ornata]